MNTRFRIRNVALAAVPRLRRIWIVAVALTIVEAFELTNGFGVMTNVYDPFDYLANSIGIALEFLKSWEPPYDPDAALFHRYCLFMKHVFDEILLAASIGF